ncbi:hypothetical protein [Streptomyces sp. NPDC046712]|uniref:hypothetical protein n=1 Tax=Streptomyces sp. NPDC046712 TaxID=3154802 RepID=UPI0033E11485
MSMPNVRRRYGQITLLGVVALTAVACSGGGSGDGDREAATKAALDSCGRVLGAENVESVRAELGGNVRAESKAPDRIKGLLLKTAQEWKPESDDFSRAAYDLCLMRAAGEENRWSVVGSVKWSQLTMQSVSKGEHSAEWRKAADDVYVQRLARTPGLAAVVPCTLPGTAAGQSEQLPLEMAVLDDGLSEDGGALSGRLLSALVANTRAFLGCRDSVSVPPVLSP